MTQTEYQKLPYSIRRLNAEEMDTALELAWNTYLEFEAPDYEPQGVDTFKRDIMENSQFKETCCNGTNRMCWHLIEINLWGFLSCVEHHIFV